MQMILIGQHLREEIQHTPTTAWQSSRISDCSGRS